MFPIAPHPVVAIGGSAGALEPLVGLVAQLPADLPAAVLVVIHAPAHSRSSLGLILSRAGLLDAELARHGEPLALGTIRIAPPDHHLRLVDGHLRLDRGPRVNSHRPSIDPLFRSVSRARGPHAVGVILSGTLDDGATGLLAVGTRGGRTIVQAPDDALFADMPGHAITRARPQHIVPAADLGTTLVEQVFQLAYQRTTATPDLTGSTPSPDDPPHTPGPLDMPDGAEGERLRGPSTYSCPACGGVLWETHGDHPSYRCRVGHAYSTGALEASQEEVIEDALWTALRAVEEQASFNERLASRAREAGNAWAVERFEERLQDAQTRARHLRRILSARVPDDVAHPRTA